MIHTAVTHSVMGLSAAETSGKWTAETKLTPKWLVWIPAYIAFNDSLKQNLKQKTEFKTKNDSLTTI